MANAEVKYTPGPWTSCDADHKCLIEAGVYANGIRIATCIAPLRSINKNANARLIAAAPDLLRVLKDVLDSMGALCNHGELAQVMNSEPDAEEVFSVISKAEGK